MLLNRGRWRAVFGVAVAAVAMAVLVTCADDEIVDPDAGPSDGGTDSGSRVGRDASWATYDAGLPDAGHDGGCGLSRPAEYRDAGLASVEWERYPGLPESCELYRAVDPADVFVPRWEPCPGAEDHCQRLAVDWAFPIWRNPDARSGNQHTGSFGYWFTNIEYPDVRTPKSHVLATTAGPPLLATRSLNTCGFGIAYAEDVVSLQVNTLSGPQPRMFVYFGRTVEDLRSLDTPVAAIDTEATGVDFLTAPAVTAERVVGFVRGSFLFEIRRTGETRRIDGLRPTSAVQAPRLVDDHLLWMEYGAFWSVIHEAEDGTIEPYIERPEADIRDIDFDEGRMVWTQGYPPGGGHDYSRHEIWTAPYVREPGDLAGAQRILSVDDHRFPMAGGRLHGDRYAFVRRPEGRQPSVDVLHLDTGELRRFTLPTCYEEITPWVIYLSDTEVMVEVGGSRLRETPIRLEIANMPVVTGG